MDILKRAQDLSEELVAHRRFFHQNPELAHTLPKSKAYIIERLKEYGYEPQEIGESGVTALVGGKKPGKVFMLRADFDALPIKEETGLPFASDNGCMHACGHDTHATMLLGAAKILKEMEDEIEGTIKLLFQPAEETLTGAQEMLDCGILENPKVDAAMMIHIASGIAIPSGMAAVFGAGPCYASADWYRIDVQGKGGHGAMPENGVSPISVLAAIHEGMQSIISLNIPASAQASMTVGQIHSGETSNIIPDTGYMAGTIRTYDSKIRDTIREKLETLVEGTAAARGAVGKVTYSASAPVAVCDKDVTADTLEALHKVLGPEKVIDLATLMGGAFTRVNGSEDFAYIAEKVPSSILMLSAGTPEDGYQYPAHHPKTDFREDAFPTGVAAYAGTAIEWLKKNK